MAERMVRVIRIWDVPVTAEYGDDDQTLLDKAKAGTVAEATETYTLLPVADSEEGGS